jgi:hypothetical protein
LSDSNLTLEDRRTPDQARTDRARKDREGWYPGRDTVGSPIILSALTGRTVAMVGTDSDRDFILQAARSFHKMKSALQNILNGFDTGMIDSPADDLLANGMKQVRDALESAKGKV